MTTSTKVVPFQAGPLSDEPLVSIVINNYNYAQYLSAAVDSALDQSYGNFEVIVVDDGSTDASRSIISGYGDRIVPALKSNGGQASAFNEGFAASRGEIICFLDSDDLFTSDKVRRIVKIFHANPGIGWCFDNVREFDSVSGIESEAPNRRSGPIDERESTQRGKQGPMHTATSGLSFRRATLQQALPMDEIIRITSDNYIKCIAAGVAPGFLSDERLTLQRIHSSNAYTKKVDGKEKLFARTALLTGISVYNRGLTTLGQKDVARGIGLLRAAGGIDPDLADYIAAFEKGLPLPTRLSVWLRASLWEARRRIIRTIRNLKRRTA